MPTIFPACLLVLDIDMWHGWAGVYLHTCLSFLLLSYNTMPCATMPPYWWKRTTCNQIIEGEASITHPPQKKRHEHLLGVCLPAPLPACLSVGQEDACTAFLSMRQAYFACLSPAQCLHTTFLLYLCSGISNDSGSLTCHLLQERRRREERRGLHWGCLCRERRRKEALSPTTPTALCCTHLHLPFPTYL